MRKDTMIFRREWLDAIAAMSLPPVERVALLEAIIRWGIDQKEPEGLSPAASAVFLLARCAMERAAEKWQRRAEMQRDAMCNSETQCDAESHSEQHGDAQRRDESRGDATSHAETQRVTVSQRETQGDSVSVSVSVSESVSESVRGVQGGEQTPPAADKPPTRQFSPPSVAEVAEYASSRGYALDAERFVAFYASKGWLVGRAKMKDWHAAVVGWAARNKPAQAVAEKAFTGRL